MPYLSPQPRVMGLLMRQQPSTTSTTISSTSEETATAAKSVLSSSNTPSSVAASATTTAPTSTTGSSAAASATPPVSSTTPFSSPTPSSTISTNPYPNSSSSPNSTYSNSTSQASNLSSGAVAGISIGTFFAGVLLALICLCFFAMLRKKKHKSYDSAGRRRHYRVSGNSQDDGTPMKQMTSTAQPLGLRNDINMNRVLLEPVSSTDIKTEMLALGSQIVQHVDNNYHLKPVDSLSASFTESLTKERYSAFAGISIEQLGKLLRNVQTRRAAIKHLISYFIFSRIALTSDVENSLLPSHIIAFLRQMPPPERTSGSREAFDQALTQWRPLSAYLLQSVRSNRDPLLPKESDVQAAIVRNVTAVRQILTLFVIPSAESRQAENLQGLMAEGARFGLLLFQQPESWVVDWEIPNPKHTDTKIGGSSQAKATAIVVFPGLIKTVDEEGKRYVEVRSVLDAELLHIQC